MYYNYNNININYIIYFNLLYSTKKRYVTNLHRFEDILFSLLPSALLSNEQINK